MHKKSPRRTADFKRSDAGTFVVLPKRWIVERTIAWLNRCRRLAKDWECLNSNALAFLRWASVRLMPDASATTPNDLGPTLRVCLESVPQRASLRRRMMAEAA